MLALAAPVATVLADTLELDRVTVTATRHSTLTLDTPASVHMLSAEELRMRAQVRSTPESLQWIPGVLIQRTGHGQGSPYIRGFTGFRTLFLIDGIRLNNSVFRDGPNQYWNTVDPFSIGELEVVKGPVSVLYGTDAIGGTVNALTRTAVADVGRPDISAQYRYSNAENANVLRVDVAQQLDERLSLSGGVSLKEFGDLVSATGTQARTGYPERDVDFKLSLDQSLGKFEALYQRVAIDDAWRTHRTIYGQSYAGTTIGNELRRSLNQRRELGYLRYTTAPLGPFQELKLTASLHKQGEDRFRTRSNGRSDHQGAEVATTGLIAEGVIDAAPGLWQFGIEHYSDDVDSFRNDFNADGSLRGQRIQGPVGDDASYSNSGAFLQTRFSTGPVA
ncbi:MAG: TonB-dependent receptor plug domain-containing protein, partial [Gammaproteobacteria bacterium]|nr:TonB-dependent receptor plug domain-containing protein [Gammaproteobacteria bacterium]